MELIRATKFFATFYGDTISEKQFFAKNCTATMDEKVCQIRIELIPGLDYDVFESNKDDFDTFEFQDKFLTNKFTDFLKVNTQLEKFTLILVAEKLEYQVRLQRIKLRNESVVTYTYG